MALIGINLGSTIYDRSVVEHNILAVSKLYKSISFDRLGQLLNVSAEQAENLTAKMFSESHLSGSIDRSVSFIFFDDGK